MTDDVKKEDKKESSDAKAMEDKGKNLSKGVEKLVDEIAKLTVLELSELVTALQDKLGVTAAVPMAAAAAPVAGPVVAGAAAEDGGGAQNLNMTSAGDNKIAVIKALREINQNWGLKEAKDMTEATPAEILKGAKPEEVKAAADKLKAAGAQVEMK
ncbi:MAG: 50S ribosomal protein L7/L12 [Microgenomates group bacterium GW2011_GWC1_37_12b]|uniref:Large ribosomal subunit protein bL12 n=1 Tax=Candidatus Woesebacteria bacterium GW2011_GWB1_38_8b TaxID=1618571 RepID=A0A0G0L4Q2_9BACT|nr:MAG: 50S ribosomal protein L7/L12 [Microgenomates group bacterium GW2011_GWC1_37_12b]KKQ86973.1 MAG: 50S ribosomal protein L7/L12 [Candidatus Woesebacteria bacterium GW2011_GWB1_38_8b]